MLNDPVLLNDWHVVSLVSKCTEHTWTRSFTPPLSIRPSQRSCHIPGG
jgi:hypothetical protein